MPVEHQQQVTSGLYKYSVYVKNHNVDVQVEKLFKQNLCAGTAKR